MKAITRQFTLAVIALLSVAALSLGIRHVRLSARQANSIAAPAGSPSPFSSTPIADADPAPQPAPSPAPLSARDAGLGENDPASVAFADNDTPDEASSTSTAHASMNHPEPDMQAPLDSSHVHLGGRAGMVMTEGLPMMSLGPTDHAQLTEAIRRAVESGQSGNFEIKLPNGGTAKIALQTSGEGTAVMVGETAALMLDQVITNVETGQISGGMIRIEQPVDEPSDEQ